MGGHLAVADLAGLVTADGLLDVCEAGATMLATPRSLSRSEGRRRGGCHQEKGREHPKLAFLRVTRRMLCARSRCRYKVVAFLQVQWFLASSAT